jgi:teichoic acid transport system permease protein
MTTSRLPDYRLAAETAVKAHGEILTELHATPGNREYLNQLWSRRTFAYRMPIRDLRAKNLNNVLGMLWFLLNPALLVTVYYLFFGLIIGTNRGVDNFLTFLSAGIFTYGFIQRTVTSSSRTLTTSIGLIRAIKFPRAILPIAETIEQTAAHIPAIFVLCAVALVTGERPTATWLLLFPLVLFQAIFALGLGLMLARTTTTFRDLQSFMPFGFRLVFYMSGVLYSVEQFVANEQLRQLFFLNPFYDHIVLVRYAILGGSFPGWAALGALIATSLALPLGFIHFRRGEPYGRA